MVPARRCSVLALYALNDQTALRLLMALGRLGYPTTGRVLRYVEDDPGGLERAIGTSVDPNSFGGMLALHLCFDRRPVLGTSSAVSAAGAGRTGRDDGTVYLSDLFTGGPGWSARRGDLPGDSCASDGCGM